MKVLAPAKLNLFLKVVNKRSDGLTFVESISGKYSFCLNENSDDHWEVIK